MFNWLNIVVEKIKNLNTSVTEYKRDTVIQSLHSLTYINRAKKLLEQEKFEDAEKMLLCALELPQIDALVYKYLGITYDKMKDYPRAVEAYQTSADMNPNDKIIWQKLGFALIATGKYAEAEKSFENSDKISSDNTDTLTGWGMALMKLCRYNEASQKFAKAMAINKFNFSAIFMGALANIKLKEYDKADSKLSFLIKTSPNETNTFEYANLKFIKEDYDNVIFYAKKSLEYNPAMLPAYILLGKAYSLKYDEGNSYNYFQEAENKELITAELYFEWGIVFKRFGKYSEAAAKFLQCLALSPDHIDAKANLGLAYAAEKNIESARPLLEFVLDREPSNAIIKQALGIVSYESSDIESAIKYFRETLDCGVDNSINYYYLAKCYQVRGNDSKVRENFSAAIQENPNYVNAYMDYINYLVSVEDYAEAQRKLRKVQKLDENSIEILNLLFFTSYMLVKNNGCEYNIKETLAIAKKIEEISPEIFKYTDEKEFLKTKLERK